MDDVDRLVGAEDHRHRRPVPLVRLDADHGRRFSQGDHEALRISCRRDREVRHRDVLVDAGAQGPALVHLAVRAQREGAQRSGCLGVPRAQGLGEQCDLGDEEEEEDAPAPVLGESLGDAQGGEGLARAAGHDELAAVRGFQAADDGVQRLPLVGSQVLLAGADRLLRLVKGEAVPVDGGAASRPLGPQPHLVEERGVRGARPRPSRFGRIRPEPRPAGRVG